MIQKLSSIKFAFYNLVFLVLLMSAGIYLSHQYPAEFQEMNDIVLIKWLKFAVADTPVLAVWFILLCLNACLLFVNAFFCTALRQLQAAIKSGVMKKWLFFVLHCLFIVVLVCHGLILVVGSKQSNLTLYPNDTIVFEEDYKIAVTDIVFKDDIIILKLDKNEQRSRMTRKNIHRKQNFAQISLYKSSTLIESKKVYMLSPLRHGAVQITVTQFVAKQINQQDQVGVTLTITRNYLNMFFFVIYGLMILTLGGYLLFFMKDGLSQKSSPEHHSIEKAIL